MPLLVNEVLDRARGVYLNDASGDRWSNTALLPYFREAWDFLQSRFMANDIDAVRDESLVITVPALTSDLSQLVNYPIDLAVPIEILERLPGEDNDSWMFLTPAENVDRIEPRDYLYNYDWREGIIRVAKSHRNIEVYIRYIRLFSEIAGENSAIFALHAKGFLGSRTAALAAGFAGGAATRAQAIGAISEQFLHDLLNIEIKTKQDQPARHLPYGYSRRNR